MTGKIQKNKRVIDCTRGLSREQRAINRRNKRESSIASGSTYRRRRKSFKEWFIPRMKKFEAIWKSAAAAEEEQFGCHDLPDRVVSDCTFEEKQFGELFARGERNWDLFIAKAAPRLPDNVVSLALFDGDEMLFACSGIALPRGTARQHLTRFLTSARLVREFIDKRNKDDQLRIEVRLPDNTATDGFLGLYDQDIAIVTSFCLPAVRPVDLDRQAPNPFDVNNILAIGRAFNSGRLMVGMGKLSQVPSVDDREPLKVFFKDITEAALGGPLIDSNGYFLGMILHHDLGKTWSLPRTLLPQRLEHFRILTPRNMQGGEDTDDCDPNDAGSSSVGTKNSRRRYSLPPGVSCIVPSGFMRTINWLKSVGYPMPPPLVLELNGRLLNKFEEDFGEVCAWKEYDVDLCFRGSGEYVWQELRKKVFTNISRCAVSLASFNGNMRFFACTGLLIKWHGSTRKRTGMRTVILTSASLVRTRDDEDKIDENLRIEVFLPPNQRADGTLELYHSNYNIAIISIEKHFRSVRPEDIFYTVQKSSENVVAIGRETAEGLLLASMGEVTDKPRNEPSELDCKDLKLSTCKIKKVGIGGPLINSDNGSFVGMNFYDDTDKTPFLPRSKIVEVLKGIDLPSERGLNCPVNIMDDAAVKINRWPVPEAYWYHPLLDEDRDTLPPHVGRVLQ